MADQKEYPKTPEEFIEQSSFKDSDEIYTNGAMLMTVYRVKEMIEQYFIPKSVARQFEEAVMPFKKEEIYENQKKESKH